MKKSDFKAFLKENIKAIYEQENLSEMAKIAGDLKSSIEKVIKDNPELENLPLKKAIKADDAVKDALGDQTLYDNQLNKFIAFVKGERTIGKRGRKADPNKPAKKPSTGKRGRPKSAVKKAGTPTMSKLDKKYYVGKDEEGPSKSDLRKLARSGAPLTKDKDKLVKAQTQRKGVQTFRDDLIKLGVVADTSNKILDLEKYKELFGQYADKIRSNTYEPGTILKESDASTGQIDQYLSMLMDLKLDFSSDSQIQEKANELSTLLTDYVIDVREASSEEVENQAALNKELEKTADLKRGMLDQG